VAPVIAGMCKYESLLDGTLDLEDIAELNEDLAVHSENLWRAQDAAMKRNR
jgi:hypothetical protein